MVNLSLYTKYNLILKDVKEEMLHANERNLSQKTRLVELICCNKISPVLLNFYVAEIIAEYFVHNGICEVQNGVRKTRSIYNFGHIIDRNAMSKANTMFSMVANTTER
jgi:hypothetical protein